jgi:hypothetical protein
MAQKELFANYDGGDDDDDDDFYTAVTHVRSTFNWDDL